jgi:hypothetical protein
MVEGRNVGAKGKVGLGAKRKNRERLKQEETEEQRKPSRKSRMAAAGASKVAKALVIVRLQWNSVRARTVCLSVRLSLLCTVVRSLLEYL